MPIVRLLVYPSLAAILFYFLFQNVLRLEISGFDREFGTLSVVAVPFLMTFFSQLHRMDVLRRIERLEKEIERLGTTSIKDRL